ncbi:hypothetical protein N658DRAFT_49042 [Parathielavia hyrcaniae]|uniref:Uncharacterized protein n=1 Tax=Parathielavia hyrcaniae TaxID=113614 RepID=A0AAN6T1G3_9PEZI|nr:hypothetical protein N658DRAFT_49042 [Parathielavia hyrcaniae]
MASSRFRVRYLYCTKHEVGCLQVFAPPGRGQPGHPSQESKTARVSDSRYNTQHAVRVSRNSWECVKIIDRLSGIPIAPSCSYHTVGAAKPFTGPTIPTIIGDAPEPRNEAPAHDFNPSRSPLGIRFQKNRDRPIPSLTRTLLDPTTGSKTVNPLETLSASHPKPQDRHPLLQFCTPGRLVSAAGVSRHEAHHQSQG